MKTTTIIKNAMLGFAVIVAVCSLSSCEKNDIDDFGSFNLKVVNASPGSPSQSFYLAGNALVSGGLKFTDASSYISTPSGTRLVCEYKSDGTGNIYGSGELFSANGVSFTVYLAGEGSSARVRSFQDDLSAPNNGKVKIKFIHLSDAAPSDINIRDASGDDLVTNLSRNLASGYKAVDPGALSVQIFGTALRKNIGNFTVSDLQAGKIYSLYLTGQTDGTLTLNKIIHN